MFLSCYISIINKIGESEMSDVRVNMSVSKESYEDLKFLQEHFSKEMFGVKVSQGQVFNILIDKYMRFHNLKGD